MTEPRVRHGTNGRAARARHLLGHLRAAHRNYDGAIRRRAARRALGPWFGLSYAASIGWLVTFVRRPVDDQGRLTPGAQCLSSALLLAALTRALLPLARRRTLASASCARARSHGAFALRRLPRGCRHTGCAGGAHAGMLNHLHGGRRDEWLGRGSTRRRGRHGGQGAASRVGLCSLGCERERGRQ